MKQFSMKTHTTKYFISTTWVEDLEVYETMVFEKKTRAMVDWLGIETRRTKNKYEAINHHITAIAHYTKA